MNSLQFLLHDVNLSSGILSTPLLLETLATWSDAMLPDFESKARSQWGEEWEGECAALLSEDMRKHVKDGGWDAYRIASIIMIKPAIFIPNYDQLSDCAKEIYRQGFTYSSRIAVLISIQNSIVLERA